jgi:EAL domain-containing protein (putative c-di-GMP-specific phosphodiesterase class I)
MLESTPGNLYWLSESEELMNKISQFFEILGLEFENSGGAFLVRCENTKEFFISNCNAIEHHFNSIAQDDIMVYASKPDQVFNFQSILKAKPLTRFVNLVRDNEFFDILNNESLTSYFQPIINAKDHSIYGYEALIRGVKSTGELMYPDELFLKSARNDCNFLLDRLCRESALKTAAVKKIHQHVFINFLPTSIYDPEFCLKSTIKWANQLEFDPKNIVFEVVETESAKDQEHLKTILKYYRNQGYKIALDDVGEGYSNLNMLIELRPDIIKVDRNIIQNIHEDSFKQSIYKALSAISKENGIAILAEGIETPYELEVIKELGVDYMQGYYFCKPQAEPIRKL